MKLTLSLLFVLPLVAQAAHLDKRGLPSVEFAYRDAASSIEGERRLVALQADRATGAAHFDASCGPAGDKCECLFFQSATDPEPLRGTGLGISGQNNSLSCLIPGDAHTPDLVKFVEVRLRADGSGVTPLMSIRTQLSLSDVLGPLDINQVRGVFRYGCSRTFFEGEGVNANSLTCVGGQHLGAITATYSYYVYQSAVDNNMSDRGGDTPFAGDVCKRNDFLAIQCAGSPVELRYGLYRQVAGPFAVGLTMTSSPTGANRDALVGYAALPDANGRCPVGFVKARPYVAQPASITQGSLDGMNPPSSFINENGRLNDNRVELATPPDFRVVRESNHVPCSADGTCTFAEFNPAVAAETVRYTPLTPVVCALPPSLLGGIF